MLQRGVLWGSACGLLVLVLTPWAMAAAAADVERAVRTFYKVYLELGVRGVPSRAQQAQFAPIISTSLASLLRGARRAEEAHRRRTKNQGPPLVEGDLFTSLFEGAHAYAIAGCRPAAATAACAVILTYVDPRDASKYTWTDRILCVRARGRWVVHDIVFDGGWDFARKGRLTDTLRAVAADRAP
jgi:hypothetical protein